MNCAVDELLAHRVWLRRLIAMAQLIVRKVDQVVVDALRRRAASHGRSAEAEHRELLRKALLTHSGRNLKRHLLRMPAVGDDLELEIRRPRARRVAL